MEEYGALVHAQLVGGAREELEEDFLVWAEKAVVAAGRGVRHTTRGGRASHATSPTTASLRP